MNKYTADNSTYHEQLSEKCIYIYRYIYHISKKDITIYFQH